MCKYLYLIFNFINFICNFAEKGEVISDHYKLLPIDLRDIQSLNDLILTHMDPSLPTFIVAECVLIYLDPDSSNAIVEWASRTFPTSVFFLYEQVLIFFNHHPLLETF
ncbi:putative [Phosphatase 2A protein]-leucine-carboxy methyltransferase [Helianthus anomalus]